MARYVWKNYPAELVFNGTSLGGNGGAERRTVDTDEPLVPGENYYAFYVLEENVTLSPSAVGQTQATMKISGAVRMGTFSPVDTSGEKVNSNLYVPNDNKGYVIFFTKNVGYPTNKTIKADDAGKYYFTRMDSRTENSFYYSCKTSGSRTYLSIYVKDFETHNTWWSVYLYFPTTARKSSNTSNGYTTNKSKSAYSTASGGGARDNTTWVIYAGEDQYYPTSVEVKGGKVVAGFKPKLRIKLGEITYPSAQGYPKAYLKYSVNGGTSWVGPYSSNLTNSGDGYYEAELPYTVKESDATLMIACGLQDGFGYSITNPELEGTKSENYTVVVNNPPTISSDVAEDLGELSNTPPVITYTVSDKDSGDVVTVTEKIGSVVVSSDVQVTLGEKRTMNITNEQWLQVQKGSGTITVTATDGIESTTKTWNFTRKVESLTATFATPFETEEMATMAVETLVSNIPVTATLLVEVCNNGFDDSPTWEDVTARVRSGEKFMISNSTKTAEKWGYNIRITVSRGETPEGTPVSISSVSGYFA